MPHDGLWLASFEVIPPFHPKVGFSAARKMKIPGENCAVFVWFLPKFSGQKYVFFSFPDIFF
jgi:hypothetical protein|tara:strand:- start:314 stop:499 length:186 start_codon:yes stop_codon:yes gene_type:complete